MPVHCVKQVLTMIIQIALGIVLAVIILGLLAEYAEVVGYIILGIIGLLALVFFWEEILVLALIIGGAVLISWGCNQLKPKLAEIKKNVSKKIKNWKKEHKKRTK